MEISKGTQLKVKHNRKGTFTGIALRDFSTDETFYPIALAKNEYVQGISRSKDWVEDEEIPCRNTLCQIEVIEN